MSEPLLITDDLLIGYLLNEVSAEQARLVDGWRGLNTDNERHFEQFRLIWESSKNFKADANIDALASLQKVKQRAAEAKAQHNKVVPIGRRYQWLKIAVAVVFMIGFAWIWFSKFNNPELRFESMARVKIDTLSDGSIVTLNKNSRLDHREKFTAEQRLVKLVNGEAFFNVAHNKAKPFIITAGAASIKVVGTSFNVKNKNGTVEIIVETGLVQVTNSFNKVMMVLKPGEMALLNAQTGSFMKLPNRDNLYKYYRSNDVVFKNIPLARLVAVLNEAYGANIVIARKELNNMEIAGSLNVEDNLDSNITAIALTLKITVEKKQGKIILK